MKKKVLIKGMSCGHCANHATMALKGISGVTSVDVNLGTKTAIVEANGDINDNDIKSAIHDAGYEVVGIEVL